MKKIIVTILCTITCLLCGNCFSQTKKNGTLNTAVHDQSVKIQKSRTDSLRVSQIENQIINLKKQEVAIKQKK